VTNNGYVPGGVMWWSSVPDSGEVIYNPQIPSDVELTTDSTIAIRVRAEPPKTECDFSNSLFSNPPATGQTRTTPLISNYSVLDLQVGVRDVNSPKGQGYTSTLTFTNIKVNECSPVRYFQKIPKINGKFALDILNVKSNTACVDRFGNYLTTCTLSYVASAYCWNISLHVATDDTKRIPE
jgi:hypothetical protein